MGELDQPAVGLLAALARDGGAEQLIVCPSLEVRDMIVGSGMEAGMQESMDALEEVAISLA